MHSRTVISDKAIKNTCITRLVTLSTMSCMWVRTHNSPLHYRTTIKGHLFQEQGKRNQIKETAAILVSQIRVFPSEMQCVEQSCTHIKYFNSLCHFQQSSHEIWHEGGIVQLCQLWMGALVQKWRIKQLHLFLPGSIVDLTFTETIDSTFNTIPWDQISYYCAMPSNARLPGYHNIRLTQWIFFKLTT